MRLGLWAYQCVYTTVRLYAYVAYAVIFDCAMEVNRVTIKGSVEDITATDVDGAYY